MGLLPDFAQEGLEDIWDAGKGMVEDVVGGAGEAVDDYMNNGKNRYSGSPYAVDPGYWGNYQGGAEDVAAMGWNRIGQNDAYGKAAAGEAFNERGPVAWENQELSDREAFARGYDQDGALQLQREAAMGLAPSAAEGILNQGFNRAANEAYGRAAGGRGAAALAVGQGQAAGIAAGLGAEASNQAGITRANEMANARGQYGQLATGQREQDLQRLQYGNQMSQFNANQNDQYRLGMGQLGQGYGNQGLGWYQAAQNPYNQQLNAHMQGQALQQGSWDNNQNNEYGRTQANADLQRQNRNEITETVIGEGKNLFQTGMAQRGGQGMGKT